MCQVIVVASGKGGTGKTTVCVSLAAVLAEKNKRTLLVDCDCGMRGVDLMLGVSGQLVYDLADVVSSGCDIKDAIYECDNPKGLFVMAAPFFASDEISPAVMRQVIDSIKKDFDYIIIDSPAGVGSGFEAAASSADRALIVINAEPISVRGCINIRKKLSALLIDDIRLVINRFDKERFYKTNAYADLDEVIDAAQTQLIAVVPEDLRLSELSQKGGCGCGWSPSKLVFDCLAQRLSGDNVPIVLEL